MFGGNCDCNFTDAIPSVYREEMTSWILGNVPACPGVFLIHFQDAIGGTENKGPARHFLGHSADVRAELLSLLDGRDREHKFSHIVNVANGKGIRWHCAKVWMSDSVENSVKAYAKRKANGNHAAVCPECKA